MPLYRNAFYWFIALLVLLVIGFWQSYFSKLFGDVHPTHHLHAIAMIGWMLLLITQSWLIRNRRNDRHRTLGKLSFVLAPAVVISGVIVTFYAQAHSENPLSPFALGIFWFGFFSVGVFAAMYVQAIRHRKNMQLHARYMILTALAFIMPGLARAVGQYIAPLGVWTPSFYQMTYVPLLIGLWFMLMDMKNSRPYKPFLVSNVFWGINAIMWIVLPKSETWKAFTAWSAANLG